MVNQAKIEEERKRQAEYKKVMDEQRRLSMKIGKELKERVRQNSASPTRPRGQIQFDLRDDKKPIKRLTIPQP